MKIDNQSIEKILNESILGLEGDERFKKLISLICMQSKMLDKLIDKYPGGQLQFHMDMNK